MLIESKWSMVVVETEAGIYGEIWRAYSFRLFMGFFRLGVAFVNFDLRRY